MRTWSLLIAATLILSCRAGVDGSREAAPRSSSVCEIVKRPREFEGVRVTFDSEVTSDGMHYTLLTDHSCEHGLVFNWSDRSPPPMAQELLDALRRPEPSTMNKTITGRFTGTLKHEEQPFGTFPYTFMLSDIENLQVGFAKRRGDAP